MKVPPSVESDLVRFFAKVELTDSCWIWTAGKDPNGYARFWWSTGRTSQAVRRDPMVYSYRWLYELTNGPIADGLVIDHLCRNRACVNPDHLEVVTQRVNILRGTGASARNARRTHCPKGHEYTSGNIYIHKRKGTQGRDCKRCCGERNREQRERHPEKRRAIKRAYYERHRDEVKAHVQEYRAQHRDEVNARRRGLADPQNQRSHRRSKLVSSGGTRDVY
jgi:hypothetical protein